jgi:hypothetical protein
VLLEIFLLALFFALGLGLQRRRPSERLRERAWTVYWWTVTPTLVFTAFTTITSTGRSVSRSPRPWPPRGS